MVKPITGALKKKIILDITTAFAIGGGLASWWWYGYHNGQVAIREKWYADYEKSKSEE